MTRRLSGRGRDWSNAAECREGCLRPDARSVVPCDEQVAGNLDTDAMQSEELGGAVCDKRRQCVVEFRDLDVDGTHVPSKLSQREP